MGWQPDMNRRRLLAACAGVTVATLVGCAPQKRATSSGEALPPTSIYVVGDSLTEGSSPDFNGGQYADDSWVAHLGDQITVVGGWAQSGALTVDMLNAATPARAGALVLLAGTNDAALGVAFETTAYNLEHIAEKVGAPRSVVSALPPRDDMPGVIVTFNRNLAALARDKGWDFIDPMAGLRDGVRFGAGMATDGVHLSVAGATELGRAMAEQLRQLR